MIGTKNKKGEKRGTKTEAKILKGPKPKQLIYIGTKYIFKPKEKYLRHIRTTKLLNQFHLEIVEALPRLEV